MSMTVLALVQAAMADLWAEVPTSIVSATNVTQIQLRNLLYSETRHLRNRRCFPSQKRTYSFSTSSGVNSYQLPRDFYAAILDTQYNDDEQQRLIGPLSDGEFAYLTKGIGSSTQNFSYRIFGPDNNPNSAGGQFRIDPTGPTSAVDLSFEYITSSMFKPKNWLPTTAYTSGVYVNANGNNYLCDTNGTSGSTAPATQTNNIADGTTQWDYVSDAYENIVLDTDLCLFDDDIVIAGFKWRYLRAQRRDYERELLEYKALLEKAETRFNGPFRGSFTRLSGAPTTWYENGYVGWRF